MSELEVIGLLGPPTSMREEGDARVLLYALEIGASGFLGGSITLREPDSGRGAAAHAAVTCMKPWFLLYGLLASAALAAATPNAVPAPSAPALAFRIDEGQNINSFFREGPVAAHLLLRSGTEPRILVAFPAGNSGVGLWFERTTRPVAWKLVTPPAPVTVLDEKHRPLRGIEFEVETDASELRPRAAVLSSVRVLRDYELQGKAPAEVLVDDARRGDRLSWTRDRLDGAAGYRLTIEARAGAAGLRGEVWRRERRATAPADPGAHGRDALEAAEFVADARRRR